MNSLRRRFSLYTRHRAHSPASAASKASTSCSVWCVFFLILPHHLRSFAVFTFACGFCAQRLPDARPGGTGVAEALFRVGPAVLTKACEVIESCPCERGCLGCILSGHCANANVDKAATALLARHLLSRLDGSLRPGAQEVPAPVKPSELNGESCSSAAREGDGSRDMTKGSSDSGSDEDADTGQAAARAMPSTSREVELSPRRKRRLMDARAMPAARRRGTTMRQPWMNSMVPDYQGMYD